MGRGAEYVQYGNLGSEDILPNWGKLLRFKKISLGLVTYLNLF